MQEPADESRAAIAGAGLVQIKITDGFAGRLVLSLLQRLFELSLEQLGLDLLVFRAAIEQRLSPCRFLLKQLGGVIEIGSFSLLGRGLVSNDLAERRVEPQTRPATRADHFERLIALQLRPGLRRSSTIESLITHATSRDPLCQFARTHAAPRPSHTPSHTALAPQGNME